jgi:predicted nucleic acid-binding protein
MSVDCFLDTNIVVYAVTGDASERPKRQCALEIMETKKFGISAQVLQEFYVTITRKSEHCVQASDAMRWLDRLAEMPCIPVDKELVRLGIEASERFRISYWDGAIIAAAQEMGARIVYSEDLSHGQHYGPVRVVNPFLDLP